MGSAEKLNRVAVIYHSERIDRQQLTAAVEGAMRDSANSQNWDAPLWLPTNANETGGPQAVRAIAQGATHVVVAGGDGTIRSVAEALVASQATDFTLGIVPIGTGNVLARNLKLDLNNLQRSVQRAINGREFAIDVGRARLLFANGDVDERFFTGMAGVGLDAKIMMATDLELKRKIGWIAYIDGGLKTLPVRFERIQVSVDGREPRRLKLHSLLVGNAGWLPGNITLMPDARLDDGQLDVAAVGPRRFWNWIDFWSRVTWQNRVVRPLSFGRRWMEMTANLKTLENLNGSHIEVESERPIDIQLDGDPLGQIIRVEFDVIARALSVRV
jgi:diacylglycerol kinase family enzyme